MNDTREKALELRGKMVTETLETKMTQQEIANKLGVTKSRISQIFQEEDEKKGITKNKHHIENSKEIKRFFNGLEVIEAKEDLSVFVTQEDIDTSIRGDEHNCVIAKCLQRLGCKIGVAIWRTIGYVDLPYGKNGEQKIVRFKFGKKLKKQIAKYDQTGEFKPGIYKLNSIKKTETLKKKIEYGRKHLEALRNGNAKTMVKKDDKRKLLSLSNVRFGNGKINLIHI